MDIKQTHAALRAKFVYTKESYDYWKLWPTDAVVKDDCDGFSLNLVLRHFGEFWKPIFKKEAILYHCKYHGVGHMVCKIDGYYCDNITPVPFVSIPGGYTDFEEYSFPMAVFCMYGIKSKWRFRLLKWFSSF